jgi:replicative DNA helicase
MISRDLDITVILISSVNRANYMQPIDFESLKESGGIEYSADCILGLQLQCLDDPIFEQEKKIKQKRELIRKAKAATPRKIELICLKNRFGISSYCCGFNYFPAADLFTEDTGREFADDLFSQAINAPRRI